MPEFLRAVRDVNESLEHDARIRVLGGSETVDWSSVPAREELAPFPFKTNHTAHLITRHLAPDPTRRVLVVYGDGHIQHGSGTLTANVEAELDPDSLFVIGTIRTLQEGERNLVTPFGDPDEPFHLAADAFPEVDRRPDALVPIVSTSRSSLRTPVTTPRAAERLSASPPDHGSLTRRSARHQSFHG